LFPFLLGHPVYAAYVILTCLRIGWILRSNSNLFDTATVVFNFVKKNVILLYFYPKCFFYNFTTAISLYFFFHKTGENFHTPVKLQFCILLRIYEGVLEMKRTQKTLIVWSCVSFQISWQTQMSATGSVDLFTEDILKIPPS